MNKRKIFFSNIFIVITITAIFVLWKLPFVLCILLILIAYLKHKIIPIKKEIMFFVIFGIIGALGESLIIMGGPWSYSTVDIINIPVWLPFLWGLAGITGVTIYEGYSG